MTAAAFHKVMAEIPANVKLVAVTKGVSWPDAAWLYNLGQRDFGENRIPEALQKMAAAPPDCRWHFIGTLQSNKVRKAVGKFALIHSVDSFDLAKKISDISLEEGSVTSILLQANTSGEKSKHGLSPVAWKSCIDQVAALKGIKVEGLMTMAPDTNDEGIIRSCFRGLRELRDDLRLISRGILPLTELSMGMSSDFKVAIEEGATIVRIGTALTEL